jgi:hypothetical protein
MPRLLGLYALPPARGNVIACCKPITGGDQVMTLRRLRHALDRGVALSG